MTRPSGGTVLGDGRYRLQEVLGSGGMASVWLATDEMLDRPVAVKLMAEHLADDPEWLERFRREAKAAAAVVHPHVVGVFDFGIDAERPYIVMAYMPGGSLRDRLERREGVPPADRVARELLGALVDVHAAGLVHRDVKPANILLDADERTHLTDFGIARADDATAMTQTGVVLGTMRYLAPEVAHGDAATEASDVYAAGIVLREVAGHHESARLSDLIERLTAADPALRPSAHQALAALDHDRTAPTRVLSPERKHATALHRKPWFPVAAGLAAVALITVLVVAAAGGRGDPASGPPLQESAPLQQQLRGLDEAIDAAR